MIPFQLPRCYESRWKAWKSWTLGDFFKNPHGKISASGKPGLMTALKMDNHRINESQSQAVTITQFERSCSDLFEPRAWEQHPAGPQSPWRPNGIPSSQNGDGGEKWMEMSPKRWPWTSHGPTEDVHQIFCSVKFMQHFFPALLSTTYRTESQCSWTKFYLMFMV